MKLSEKIDTVIGWIIVIAMIVFCFWLTGCKTFKPSRYDEPIGAYHNLTVREFDSLLYKHDKILLRQIELLIKPQTGILTWDDWGSGLYFMPPDSILIMGSDTISFKQRFKLTY